MTYTYQVISTGEEIDVEQRITDEAHEVLELRGEYVRVKRVISGTPAFDLRSGPSGGWGSSGYSKPENHRWAETVLNRPLVKPNGGK